MSQPFEKKAESKSYEPPFHLFKRPTCLDEANWLHTGYACFEPENCELCKWFSGDFFNEEEFDGPILEEREQNDD